VPNAPPTLVGPRVEEATKDPLASLVAKDAKPVDLSDIDPLAPKYKELVGTRRENPDCRSAPRTNPAVRADRLGRDVLSKAVKGAEISIFVGFVRSRGGNAHRHRARRAGGLRRRQAGRLLEWVYNVFTSIPTSCSSSLSLRCSGAASARW